MIWRGFLRRARQATPDEVLRNAKGHFTQNSSLLPELTARLPAKFFMHHPGWLAVAITAALLAEEINLGAKFRSCIFKRRFLFCRHSKAGKRVNSRGHFMRDLAHLLMANPHQLFQMPFFPLSHNSAVS
ncbi:MAG: hypothetical protein ONB48_07795 [candidate division KSB1 bacterium]|nr:hypothetical protein [candidate division KSB1 bacterium]MDZ7274725.1 hypothetical protein [candidate division KSB1 bacterium]MDZ7285550.1 hypothetical protein [candidate division KSB1 bacterium]MDZ7298582.1 hypothetical protein [candidate division KSB1 bacterium]MDZ7349446.1 hypothetical protein [candidate division KSB1 bacterium]